MLKALSTASALALVFLSGCVDPKGSFNEFAARVVDAAPSDNSCPSFPSGVPDVTGSWLFGAFDASLNPPADIQYLFALKANTDGTVDATAQPINFKNHKLIGAQFTNKGIPLDGCKLRIPFNTTVPAAANPVNEQEAVLEATIPAFIHTKDLICGTTIEGVVTSLGNYSLAKTAFAMIRLTDEQVSSGNYPPSSHDCPKIE